MLDVNKLHQLFRADVGVDAHLMAERGTEKNETHNVIIIDTKDGGLTAPQKERFRIFTQDPNRRWAACPMLFCLENLFSVQLPGLVEPRPRLAAVDKHSNLVLPKSQLV